MSDAKQDLSNYLKKKGNLLQQVKRYSLSAIYIEELKDIDQEEYTRALLKIQKQKELNELFLQEIKEISKIAQERGIKLVFLKGYCLSEDIFNPPEMRESNDMDILVDYDDINDALKIFEEVGYTYSFKRKLVGTPIRKIYDINHYTHIHPMLKKVESKITNKKTLISVDLHINPLYHMPNYKKNDPKSVIYRAVYQKKDFYQVWVLEIHDRLLHLMGHFERHIVEDIHNQLNKTKNQVAFIRLRIFHEMVILIDKYIDQINWNILSERAKIMNQCEGVALSIALLKEIYPGRISEDKSEKLINIINDPIVNADDIEVIVCKFIIKNIKNWVFEDPFIFVHKLIQHLRKDTLKIGCRYSEQTQCVENNSFQLRNIFYKKNFRRIAVELLTKREQEFMKNYYGFAQISWNNETFNLCLHVISKSEKCDDVEKNIETISFNLDTGKSKNYGGFTERFVIFLPTVYEDEENLRLIRDNWNYKDYVNIDRSAVQIKSEKKEFYINMLIPWNVIKINPYIGRKLGFEIAIAFKENDKNNVFYMKWSNKNSSKVFPNAQESEEIILV
ncbi:nucleotidyltransferase family protein [Clostridium felsineum]|uniref:nucleotidyltransferase family protein n=1 Tax=Clostridium felsineum TaxID=36839 RepID=UPI0009CDA194|nr:nucleotidyltransferase family protein [Clostridium felsineum]URZ18167.1 hypothetical protein CLFE_042220 [Clostridium felsineum DSM 794]